MRAVVLEGHGGPEVLRVAEVAPPPIGPGLVRVQVRAAGLNRADLLQRMGLYASPEGGEGPEIPGLEYAGEVSELGAGVRGLKLGERVFGIVSGGAQAEQVVVPERAALRIPDLLDDVHAAAIPEAFITAHDALFTLGELGPGERVLIHAIGSGVGLAGLALARAAGATVIGTSRTGEKLDRARALGLEVGILSASGRFSEAVRAATGDEGVRVIADFIGAPALAENLTSLAIGGRLISIGLLGGATAELNLGLVLRNRLRIIGTALRSRPLEEKIAAARAFEAQGLPLLARGKVKPVIDRVYPAEEIQAAHQQMASNASFGKIVLTF